MWGEPRTYCFSQLLLGAGHSWPISGSTLVPGCHRVEPGGNRPGESTIGTLNEASVSSAAHPGWSLLGCLLLCDAAPATCNLQSDSDVQSGFHP